MSSASSASSAHVVVKKRWLGFLIWQEVASTVVYLLLSIFFPFPGRIPAASVLSFLAFSLSLHLLSLSLFLLSSPCPEPSASIADLVAGLLRACLRAVIGGTTNGDYSADFRHRVYRTLSKCFFLFICVLSGFLSTAALCGRAEPGGGMKLVGLGINGAMFGLVYGVHYLYHKSLKMGLYSSLREALKLSTLALIPSLLVTLFVPDQFRSRRSIGPFILYLANLYTGVSVISFTWELSTHLLLVVHTRRCHFAPSRGSAAVETNPSEELLEALEQSSPRSLLKYLAYLDLCMVSENNVEPWRAAFFEETGETYRRVISLCLRPLEHLTSKLVEGLEGLAVDKSDLFSQQLNPLNGTNVDSNLHVAFNEFQLYSWSARTIAALTSRSYLEDRYGVAQLTGLNIAVLSTLLSTLLAVEACMGKKTSSQAAHLMGPSSIGWVTLKTARHDGANVVTIKKRGGLLHAKAYSMADILRTSIYQIVSVFHAEMQAAAKSSGLEKNWVALGKPLYGTREALIHKLLQFLEYRAY
ncbi:uncharacterized protein LOC110095371 isoform X2 [Dendrobium catenatum]|uniref:uncharacterized protein LOC110095371 isoform X2 n=1 Tax=Dendrobium catenatum TaxID=906689 RepID=UPI0009F3173B|nr:uncharacterized protein LOC110095371 isoform X2 [Dendrobium catenatum]